MSGNTTATANSSSNPNNPLSHSKRPDSSSWTVPRPTDEERKALLKNKYSLRGLAPNFKRGKAVFERNTLKIVEMDVLGNELFHLGAKEKRARYRHSVFKVPKKFSIAALS